MRVNDKLDVIKNYVLNIYYVVEMQETIEKQNCNKK